MITEMSKEKEREELETEERENKTVAGMDRIDFLTMLEELEFR